MYLGQFGQATFRLTSTFRKLAARTGVELAAVDSASNAFLFQRLFQFLSPPHDAPCNNEYRIASTGHVFRVELHVADQLQPCAGHHEPRAQPALCVAGSPYQAVTADGSASPGAFRRASLPAESGKAVSIRSNRMAG